MNTHKFIAAGLMVAVLIGGFLGSNANASSSVRSPFAREFRRPVRHRLSVMQPRDWWVYQKVSKRTSVSYRKIEAIFSPFHLYQTITFGTAWSTVLLRKVHPPQEVLEADVTIF